jgi:uncharacterized protein
MTLSSAFYEGIVIHERVRPKRHRLRYRVFSLLLDLDELPSLDRNLRLFGYNRGAVFSFFERDHGRRELTGLRDWVTDHLASAGIAVTGLSIRVLCYPRMFGYAFNPLSVFFCDGADGNLVAILYEVSNTFGEKHTYVLPAERGSSEVVRQTCRKEFFVSPFIEMSCAYKFRIVSPADKVSVAISQNDERGHLLSATFVGHRKPLSDATLARALVSHPLMTFKVIGGIHWEALRLWLKGIPMVPYRRASQSVGASVVGRSE